MPLYELVLEAQDGPEVRVTDQPIRIGDVLEMQNIHWEVVRELAPSDRAAARFQCLRAQEMQRTDREIQARAERTRQRLGQLRRRMEDA